MLRNWELDPEHYTNETIAEMKLMVRVLSRKAHESAETEESSPPVCPNPDAPPLPTLRCASSTPALITDYIEDMLITVSLYLARKTSQRKRSRR